MHSDHNLALKELHHPKAFSYNFIHTPGTSNSPLQSNSHSSVNLIHISVLISWIQSKYETVCRFRDSYIDADNDTPKQAANIPECPSYQSMLTCHADDFTLDDVAAFWKDVLKVLHMKSKQVLACILLIGYSIESEQPIDTLPQACPIRCRFKILLKQAWFDAIVALFVESRAVDICSSLDQQIRTLKSQQVADPPLLFPSPVLLSCIYPTKPALIQWIMSKLNLFIELPADFMHPALLSINPHNLSFHSQTRTSDLNSEHALLVYYQLFLSCSDITEQMMEQAEMDESECKQESDDAAAQKTNEVVNMLVPRRKVPNAKSPERIKDATPSSSSTPYSCTTASSFSTPSSFNTPAYSSTSSSSTPSSFSVAASFSTPSSSSSTPSLSSNSSSFSTPSSSSTPLAVLKFESLLSDEPCPAYHQPVYSTVGVKSDPAHDQPAINKPCMCDASTLNTDVGTRQGHG